MALVFALQRLSTDRPPLGEERRLHLHPRFLMPMPVLVGRKAFNWTGKLPLTEKFVSSHSRNESGGLTLIAGLSGSETHRTYCWKISPIWIYLNEHGTESAILSAA